MQQLNSYGRQQVGAVNNATTQASQKFNYNIPTSATSTASLHKVNENDHSNLGEPKLASNKPKCNRRKIYLTQEQIEALVLGWREKGFGDLNNWIQSGKADQSFDFIENPIEAGVRTFTCKLEIFFPNFSNVPGFSALGTGKSKKEAKKLAQERIMLEIIKEGFINLGYKDDSFVDRIPPLADVRSIIIQNASIQKDVKPDLYLTDCKQTGQEPIQLTQSSTFDPQQRLLVQSKQKEATQSDMNAFFKDLSMAGLEHVQAEQANLQIAAAAAPKQSIQTPTSINDKSAIVREKEEIQKKLFKLSKQMQEHLKQDKYFEACQILVQILSKKVPEWNEVNHIWSYALLSKDIVYIKVLLDLIIQKTITKGNLAKEGTGDEQTKKEIQIEGSKKKDDENIEQAKKELMRKYGNNISRLETDNVYDLFDTFTLMMNRPDIENQGVGKVGDEEEDEEQDSIVTDLSQAHLQREIEAQILNEQLPNEIIAPFDAQVKSLEKKQVLSEIDSIKKQIEYCHSVYKMEQNLNQCSEQDQSQIEFISTHLNGDEQNNQQDEIINGQLPTKRVKLNEDTNQVQQIPPNQDVPISGKAQESVQTSEYQIKIAELNGQLKQKEQEVKKIDEEYQQFLKLQDQRQKKLDDSREQQRQHEFAQQQLRNQNPQQQNKVQGNVPVGQFYHPQQQMQQMPQYGYGSYTQQQPPFQYPTMAYNHYDYTTQNSAIFQQQSYFNQYYTQYNTQMGYPQQQQQQQQQQQYPYGYPVQQVQPQAPYPVMQQQYQGYSHKNIQHQTSSQSEDKHLYTKIHEKQIKSDRYIDQQINSGIANIYDNTQQNQSEDLTSFPQQENINYLKYNLIDEMYESLLYIGDMAFALTVAELIYSKVKICSLDFLNQQAAHYYSNKKNMLIIELIEYIFQVFNSSKPRLTEAFSSLNGTVAKIGNKFSQEVLLFKPADYETNIDQKIAKKGLLEQRENYTLIAEGEFVILTSLTQQNNNDHISLYQDLRSSSSRQYLIQFLNQIASSLYNQPPDVKAFYNKISENGQEIEFAMIGYVREISKDSTIKIFVLPTPQQSRAISEGYRIWKITKLVNKTTYERTNEALLKFATTKCVSDNIMNIILTPLNCDKQTIQQQSEKIVFTPTKNTLVNPSLNHSQQTALQFATTRALTLIQGPPGTGKTTTAVQIVQEWCRQSTDQVLACADSNIAVDILHREFVKAGIRACRIGPGSEQKNELMQDHKYRNYIDQFKKQAGKNPISAKYMFMKKLIQDSQVVCATNVGSMSEYLKEQNFTRVIVDEATQSTEMSAIIPFINKAQQVVLVGDHKQLPPTVLSSFAQSKGMTISLFERLVKQGIQPKMLMKQYRMHPSISLFPSHQFYNNMLENGVNEIQRPPIEGFLWPNKLLRIAFINVTGQERISQSSVQNSLEVQVVVEIIVDVLKPKKLPLTQIGVITPYDAQKRKIKSEIANLSRISPQLFTLSYQNEQYKSSKIPSNQIEVDTIDGYQGMEKDMIIISTVRSNTNGCIGFLKDPRRMNVALTRAKRGLIIVGNMNTLQKDSNWREFIIWVNANKAVIQYGINNNNNNHNLNAYNFSQQS